MRHQVMVHRRLHGDSHSGEWCELLLLESGTGTYIHYGHEIGRAVVMEGVVPSVWIKSSRAGVRVLARAVLPKAVDPASGSPLTVLLLGEAYDHVGAWQRLEVQNVAKQLARQQRVLRQQYRRDVSIEDAFLDRLMLNVYTGPGRQDIRIDDLEVSQYISHDELARQVASPAPRTQLPQGTIPVPGATTVDRRGSMVFVNEVPFAARVMEHNGEPLTFLRGLGFNAVRLRDPPTPKMLEDARRNEMFVVASWPKRNEAQGPADSMPSPSPAALACVLAWEIAVPLSSGERPSSKAQLASLAQKEAPAIHRPIAGHVDSDLAPEDGLDIVIRRGPAARWDWPWTAVLPGAMPGPAGDSPMRFSLWEVVPTEYPPSLIAQFRAFGIPDTSLPGPTADELRQRLRTLMARGCRGVVFASETPLAPDGPLSYRAAALEQANLDLRLLHPWMSSGRVAAHLPTSRPEVRAVISELDHAKLLWLLMTGAGGAESGSNILVTVPGVPESYKAYALSTAGFEPLTRQKRVTGGVQLELPSADPLLCVVLAHHPHVVNGLAGFLRGAAPRAARLERRLLAENVQNLGRSLDELSGHESLEQARQLHAQAKEKLAHCGRLLDQGQHRDGYLTAREGNRLVAACRAGLLAQFQAAMGPRVSCPLAVSPETGRGLFAIMQFLSRSPISDNLLPEGDFENLDAMRAAGWRYFRQPGTPLLCGAELSVDAPHGGRRGLRLDVRSDVSQSRDPQVLMPPAWVTSPPVAVRKGDLVLIEGWVRVPRPLGPHGDGLIVMDSLGGEPLAIRLRETQGWQRFLLIRRAAADGEVSTTIALADAGEAWIDDLTLRVARGLPVP